MSPALIDVPERLVRLERTLSLTIDLLHHLIERLDGQFGQALFGEDMKRLAAEAREDAERIDALVREKKRPAAAKLFREVAGVTWDEAHKVIGAWNSYPLTEKVKWLRLNRSVKALEQIQSRSP